MTARLLTPPERRWVRRLETVLLSCPSSLELVTHGDADLMVIDRALAAGDLHDGHARRRGAVVADIRSACRIHGVAG